MGGDSSRALWTLRVKGGTITAIATFVAILTLGVPASSLAQVQGYKLLHSFTRGADGGYPYSLISDAAGNLYGTTYEGGNPVCAVYSTGCGVVFKLDPTGRLTTLYSFAGGSDGENPTSGLMRDPVGNLYGTAQRGGVDYSGVIFKLSPAGNLAVLYSFAGGIDGSGPNPLIHDAAGNFYGTTFSGGNSSCPVGGCGTVFKLDPAGKETVLYSFTGGADGQWPAAGLIRDSAGNLYGTALTGGIQSCSGYYGPGCGVVFKLDPSGQETVLYSFTGGADGAFPATSLISDASGNLYGTTIAGGDPASTCGAGVYGPGCGAVFKLDTSGQESTLYALTGGTDGGTPLASLIWGPGGNLCGTADFGGAFGFGVVFSLDLTGKETVLHSFGRGPDGKFPAGSLIHDAAGNLYGTTSSGGVVGYGTVFEITHK